MNSYIGYKEFWEKVECFNYRLLCESSLNNEQKDFVQAIKALENGELEKVEKILTNLYLNAEENSIRKNSSAILVELLRIQSKYEEILRLAGQSVGFEDKSCLDIASICSKNQSVLYDIPEEEILPITLAIKRLPEVEVKLNGKVQRFLVDTGAMITVLASDIAELCNVNVSSDEAITVTASTKEETSTNLSIINELNIGSFNIRNQPAVIIPKEALTLIHPTTKEVLKINGIIGWDIIQYIDLLIDYKEKRIIIRKPSIREGLERNLFFCGPAIVRLNNVDKTNLYFQLDTGARKTGITKDVFNKMKFDNLKSEKRSVGGVGGFVEREVEYIDRLKLYLKGSPIELENVSTGIPKIGVFFKLDGILGSDIVKDGCLRVDYQNGIAEIYK